MFFFFLSFFIYGSEYLFLFFLLSFFLHLLWFWISVLPIFEYKKCFSEIIWKNSTQTKHKMIVGSWLLNKNWVNKNDFTLVTYFSSNIIIIKLLWIIFWGIAFSKSLKMEITLPKILVVFWCDT
jgi:hypothetical protein